MAVKQEEINSTNLMNKLVKKRRFWAIIVFAILCSLGDNSSTPTTQTPVQKVDVVQERINRINELYAEESSFDRVEVI